MLALRLLLATALVTWSSFTQAAPSVSQIDNLTLDSSGMFVFNMKVVPSCFPVSNPARSSFFISYDGLVNVDSFQQNAVITYSGYEYAGWYVTLVDFTLIPQAKYSLHSMQVHLDWLCNPGSSTTPIRCMEYPTTPTYPIGTRLP